MLFNAPTSVRSVPYHLLRHVDGAIGALLWRSTPQSNHPLCQRRPLRAKFIVVVTLALMLEKDPFFVLTPITTLSNLCCRERRSEDLCVTTTAVLTHRRLGSFDLILWYPPPRGKTLAHMDAYTLQGGSMRKGVGCILERFQVNHCPVMPPRTVPRGKGRNRRRTNTRADPDSRRSCGHEVRCVYVCT